MRNIRLKYKNSIHHVMNRGDKGEKIFYSQKLKRYFIRLIEDLSKKFGIEIYAYVVLDNHYHIILKNTSGNISKFMMVLNSKYALYYRSINKGKGYVFQNRFRSILIQNERYIRECLIYLYLNPVRSGLTSNAYNYRWSSLYKVFESSPLKSTLRIIIDLFGSIDNFNMCLVNKDSSLPNIKKFKNIDFIGTNRFILHSISVFERRKQNECKANPRRRTSDKVKIPIKLIHEEIYKKFKINLKYATRKTVNVKKAYSILISLKDNYLMSFKEINELKLFNTYSYKSLSNIYNRYNILKNKKIKHS